MLGSSRFLLNHIIIDLHCFLDNSRLHLKAAHYVIIMVLNTNIYLLRRIFRDKGTIKDIGHSKLSKYI